MTREAAAKHKDTIVAFAEGKEIEYLNVHDVWYDIDEPSWEVNYTYRVKAWTPKPGEMIEVWDGDESIPVTREFACMTKDKKRYVVHNLSGAMVYSYTNAKRIKK